MIRSRNNSNCVVELPAAKMKLMSRRPECRPAAAAMLQLNNAGRFSTLHSRECVHAPSFLAAAARRGVASSSPVAGGRRVAETRKPFWLRSMVMPLVTQTNDNGDFSASVDRADPVLHEILKLPIIARGDDPLFRDRFFHSDQRSSAT